MSTTENPELSELAFRNLVDRRKFITNILLDIAILVAVLSFAGGATYMIINYQNTERDTKVSRIEQCRSIEDTIDRSKCIRGS